jgi:hypothetical protein
MGVGFLYTLSNSFLEGGGGCFGQCGFGIHKKCTLYAGDEAICAVLVDLDVIWL